MSETTRELPRYKCHKEVHALKIASIDAPYGMQGSATLHFQNEEYAPITVGKEYNQKHGPLAGGYYVVYQDGYMSWSPAEVFEAGYALIEDQP